ncbi:MAG TPA: rod shape-determining protein MreD [Nitrospinota bacterium]|nr:rod shape-determining protein MreD [Nitrospinota bacterium]
MSYLYFFSLVSTIFLVQTTSLHHLAIYGIQPDLVLVLTIYFSFKSKGDKGIIIGALLGLLQDLLSSGILGLNFFTKGFIAFLVGNLRNNIAIGNIVTQVTIIFFSALFEGFLVIVLFKIFFPQEYILKIFSGFVLYRAVYCSVIGIPLMALFDKLEIKWLRREGLI